MPLHGTWAPGWLEEDAAPAMLAWPHSAFGAHVGPAIAGEDRAGLLRVARDRGAGDGRRPAPRIS